MKEDIKNIIYQVCHKGGMSDDLISGQIIGIRTGDGLELDILADELVNYFNSIKNK